MSLPGVGEIDYQLLLELLDVSNIHLVGQHEIGFSCIFVEGHAFGDQNPSCHMSREHGAWRCKSCQRSGGLVSFVGSARHCSPMEALRWLQQQFGEVYVEPRGGIVAEVQGRLTKKVDVARRIPDEGATIGPDGIFYVDWRDQDEPAYRYMVGKRGMDPYLCKQWHLGWDSYTSRVTIPYRDDLGRLIGFNARSIHDDHRRRYMVLGDDGTSVARYGVGYGFDMMAPERHLFGLYEAAEALKEVPIVDRELAVVEGELNRIAISSLPNVVSVGNAWISATQIYLLRCYCSSVVLFFDSDQAGETAVWGGYDAERDKILQGAVQQLSPFLRVRVVDDHEGDPASMGDEAAVELIARARNWLRVATQ